MSNEFLEMISRDAHEAIPAVKAEKSGYFSVKFEVEKYGIIAEFDFTRDQLTELRQATKNANASRVLNNALGLLGERMALKF